MPLATMAWLYGPIGAGTFFDSIAVFIRNVALFFQTST
jgi:hypothetical protein